MVSKQTLPEFYIFVSVILILVAFSLSPVLSANIQYCWKGTEDDHTSWRNISCATGQTYIPNAMSLTHSSADPPDDPSKKYYCMVFTVYEEDNSNNITSQTLTADYGCDQNDLCKGKNMLEDFKVVLNGKLGSVQCCDSGNNCNTHELIHQQPLQHSCYSGKLSTKTLHVETCPQQKSNCVRQRKKEVSPSAITIVEEKFFCDLNNKVCASLHMNEVQRQGCTESSSSDQATPMETETCCCKDDLCFIPTWREEANTDNVMTRSDKQSTWQQTLLIIIGIALGILVVSVAVFIMIRSVRNKEKAELPRTQYSITAYRSVHASHSTGEEDTVQILPDTYA